MIFAGLPTDSYLPNINRGAKCYDNNKLCDNLKYYPKKRIQQLIAKNLNRMIKVEETTKYQKNLISTEKQHHPICRSQMKIIRVNGMKMAQEICL